MPRDRGEEQTPFLRFFLLVFLVLVFDQLTKFLALSFLAAYDSVPVIPNIFHLTLVHNTGIAFGFFNRHREILFAAISLSLVFLGVWGARSTRNSPPAQSFALALILGGAIGNWLDRLRFGAVVDFLDFRVWPVFNGADSAITIGVVLYFWSLLRKPA